MKKLILSLIAICILSGSVFAEGAATDKKTVYEMLDAYSQNSPSVKQIRSYYEYKSLEFSLQEEQINSISPDLLTPHQLADYQLSLDTGRFYSTYKTQLQDEQIKILKTAFLSQCLNLFVLDAQAKYYSSEYNYYSTLAAVESKKLSKGYSLPYTVSCLDAQVQLSGSKLSAVNNSVSLIKSNVTSNTGINPIDIDLPIPDSKTAYTIDELCSRFINNNTSIINLNLYITEYSDYYNAISLINGVSEIERLMAQAQIQNYRDQLEETDTTVKAYVRKYYYGYETAYMQMLSYEYSMYAYSDKMNAVNRTYLAGKGTEIEAAKALMEYNNAVYNYYTQVKNVILYQYILNNSVYGFTE